MYEKKPYITIISSNIWLFYFLLVQLNINVVFSIKIKGNLLWYFVRFFCHLNFRIINHQIFKSIEFYFITRKKQFIKKAMYIVYN